MPNLSMLVNWSQILALIVAVIATVVAIKSYRLSRKKSELTYTSSYISTPIFVGADKTVEDRLKILFDGREIQNLRVMRLKLENASDKPLRYNHIVKPITFTFEPDSEILTWPQVISSHPDDIEVEFSMNAPNVVSFTFDLLNPSDELTVEFVWSGPPLEPTVKGRVEGIEEINKTEPDKMAASMALLFLSQLVYLIIILGLTIGVPITLLIGGGLVDNVLSPRDFFVGISVGVIISGLLGFTATRLHLIQKRRNNLRKKKYGLMVFSNIIDTKTNASPS